MGIFTPCRLSHRRWTEMSVNVQPFKWTNAFCKEQMSQIAARTRSAAWPPNRRIQLTVYMWTVMANVLSCYQFFHSFLKSARERERVRMRERERVTHSSSRNVTMWRWSGKSVNELWLAKSLSAKIVNVNSRTESLDDGPRAQRHKTYICFVFRTRFAEAINLAFRKAASKQSVDRRCWVLRCSIRILYSTVYTDRKVIIVRLNNSLFSGNECVGGCGWMYVGARALAPRAQH